MPRLIRLTLLLIVICAAAIFAARLIGSTRPNPLAILFTNPDGTPCQRPCLLGVRPGVTKYEDAVAILRTHPFMQQPNQQEVMKPYGVTFISQTMTIDLHRGNAGTNYLVVTFQSLSYTPSTFGKIGDMFNLLGEPNSIILKHDGVAGHFICIYERVL